MEKKKIEKYLIVGLGNPGEKYKETRHNFGFEVLDYFLKAKNESKGADFPVEFQNEPQYQSLFCLFNLGDKKIFLAKPQTFMNLSGQAVRKIIDYYKIEKKNVLIVHDDIDLELGAIRCSANSGSAGHRGVNSIIEELKGKDFFRLRLGIKNEDFIAKTKMPTEKFVLEKFLPEEKNKYIKTLENAAEALDFYIEHGFEKTAEKFN